MSSKDFKGMNLTALSEKEMNLMFSATSTLSDVMEHLNKHRSLDKKELWTFLKANKGIRMKPKAWKKKKDGNKDN